MKETKTTHFYVFYGMILKGYGPSMDPHTCGDETQPCVKVTREREVSEWTTVSEEWRGGK